MKHIVAPLILALSLTAYAAADNPYAGQQVRDIKALSPEETHGYLAGKGMGLAKAAELNGYPGPAHVLSIATELELSPKQTEETKRLFDAMDSKAKELGQQLVASERELDFLFTSHKISDELLASHLAHIGQIQSSIRQAHLEAHLAQLNLLTPEQVKKYNELRGYANSTKPAATHVRHQVAN